VDEWHLIWHPTITTIFEKDVTHTHEKYLLHIAGPYLMFSLSSKQPIKEENYPFFFVVMGNCVQETTTVHRKSGTSG